MNESANSTQLKQNDQDKLKGIWGWLVLPAIGLIIGPIIGVIGLYGLYQNAAHTGYGGIYGIKLIVGTGLLVFVIYALIKFFGKKKDTPKIMITLYAVIVVASVVFVGTDLSTGTEKFTVMSGMQLFQHLITAAIWIPYFKVSKRVKATFVE